MLNNNKADMRCMNVKIGDSMNAIASIAIVTDGIHYTKTSAYAKKIILNFTEIPNVLKFNLYYNVRIGLSMDTFLVNTPKLKSFNIE